MGWWSEAPWEREAPECSFEEQLETLSHRAAWETAAPKASDRGFEELALRMAVQLVQGLAQHYTAQARFVPSLWAIVDDQSIRFGTLREKIDSLEESWRAHNSGRSVTDYNHFAYFQIIGSGPFAVPILLEKVKAGSNSWFIALRAISGITAETPDMRGNPKAVRDAWIRWGDQYVHSAEAPGKFIPPSQEPPQAQLGQR